MAGAIIVDAIHAATSSQLVIENGLTLTPPTVADVNGVQIGTFCRAWVNFNASSGTPVIRSSFNVSSITDVNLGRFTVNFTNAMPDANFSVVASCSAGSATSTRNTAVMIDTLTTTSVFVDARETSNNFIDATYFCVAVFR